MLYKAVIEAKNKSVIPIFVSGRLAHSKYNPEKEAEGAVVSKIGSFIKEGKEEGNASKSVLFLVLGLAGGYHIKAISKLYPLAKLLVLENSREDIEYLKKNVEAVKELLQNKNIVFFSIDEAETTLLKHYLIVEYQKFYTYTLTSWEVENKERISNISKIIKGTLDKIKVDYDTQAYFGKIWQHNILKNIKEGREEVILKIAQDKTCIVVAAGPSLKKCIEKIKRERDKYFIIATDTAYGILTSNGIVSDIVISVDAQNLTINHYFSKVDKSTLFIFDISSTASLTRYIKEKGGKVAFCTTGHPLAQWIEKLSCHKFFLNLTSIGGSVTIKALDLGVQLGFSKIEVIGADYGYINGKAYAKGGYLDALYLYRQSRLKTYEAQFCSLLYRLPIIKTEEAGKITNKRLLLYKEEFLTYIKRAGLSYIYKEGKYSIISSKGTEESAKLGEKVIKLGKYNKEGIKKLPPPLAFYPYVAYLQKKDLKAKKALLPLEEYIKLAINDFLLYTM